MLPGLGSDAGLSGRTLSRGRRRDLPTWRCGVVLADLNSELPVVRENQVSGEIRIWRFGQQADQRAVDQQQRREFVRNPTSPANGSAPSPPDLAQGRPAAISDFSASSASAQIASCQISCALPTSCR